jgi:hypothetical protein
MECVLAAGPKIERSVANRDLERDELPGFSPHRANITQISADSQGDLPADVEKSCWWAASAELTCPPPFNPSSSCVGLSGASSAIGLTLIGTLVTVSESALVVDHSMRCGLRVGRAFRADEACDTIRAMSHAAHPARGMIDRSRSRHHG